MAPCCYTTSTPDNVHEEEGVTTLGNLVVAQQARLTMYTLQAPPTGRMPMYTDQTNFGVIFICFFIFSNGNKNIHNY